MVAGAATGLRQSCLIWENTLIRTLLVDDEQPARDRLRQMLAALPDVEVIGEAVDGIEAVEQIERLRPDLVFLDIQMPGKSGLEVAASLHPPRPRVVFCTAFDQYALQAFEHHAVDYLLKPVTRSRLAESVQRIRQPLAEQRRWRHEIEEAKEVQEGLFPGATSVTSGLDYAGSCREAMGVGGDYYDFIPLGPDRIGIVLADISGKGVSAALLMAGLHARLQALAPRWQDRVAELLSELNLAMILPGGQNRFATLFYGLYDGTLRTLTFGNAGHLPPILCRAAEVCGGLPGIVHLKASGTVLGCFRDAIFQQTCVDVSPGDLLMAFSDGVSEAVGPKGEEFGEDRIVRLAIDHKGLASAELRDRILEEVTLFTRSAEPHDDRTLIVVKFG